MVDGWNRTRIRDIGKKKTHQGKRNKEWSLIQEQRVGSWDGARIIGTPRNKQ